MDEIKELAELLKSSRDVHESSLTIKWAAVIGILVLICGGLFAGFAANASRITRLEAQYSYTIENITELKSSNIRMETLLQEIRFDQKRRQMMEVK